ncbi:MAG: cation:proton antiporter, partial [Bacteroidota bacterium]
MLRYTAGLAIVTVASFQIASLFQRFKLPLITGFLFTGIVAGPFVLMLMQQDGVKELDYINDFSLAFIAFAAGSELYLKDLAGRFRSIAWNTAGQLV